MVAETITSLPSEHLANLTDQYRQIVSRAWSSILAGDARIPLTQVFVLLEAVQRHMPRPLEQRSDLPDLPDRMERAGLKTFKESTPKPVPIPLSQVLLQERHLALLGEPGSGKSTTLQFIGLCFAIDGWEQKKLGLADPGVPIRLDLKELAGDLARPEGSLLDALSLSVNHVMELADPSQARELVFNWRDSGRLVVLLDGLDEVPDQQRPAVQSKIERLSYREADRKVRLIVASRPAGYVTFPESIKEFTLKPFSGEQEALPYLEKWLSILRPDWDAQATAGRLLNEMNTQPALSRLTDNPLLLRLSAEVYARTESLASSRADLYHKYIHQEAWPRALRRGADPGLKETALKELKRVAWKMQSGKTLTQIEHETLLREQMGLLARAGDRFAFSHTTFQEYFVAQYLRHFWREQREATWSFLRPRLHRPAWREPLLLMIGRQEKDGLNEDETEELILRVLRAGSRYEKHLHRDLLLAANMLRERKDQAGPASQAVLKRALRFFRWPFGRNTYNRKKTFEALVQLGSPEALLALRELLKDEEFSVRGSVARALGNIRSPESVATLRELLKDEDDYVRRSAAEALGSIGSPEALLALRELLKDEEFLVRGSAAEALGSIGSPEAVATLRELLKDEAFSVRSSAAEALGIIGSPEAVATLRELLKDEDRSVRRFAAEALGRIGSPEDVLGMRELLKDEDGYVRRTAAEALGRIGSLEAVPALLERLKDEKFSVQSSAAKALGRIGSLEAVPALLERLKDEDRDVRGAAAKALGSIGSPEAVPALLERLKDEDRDVRGAAAKALGSIGSPEAANALHQLLKDEDRSMRSTAALELVRIGSPEAVPALRAVLKNEYSHVRLVVAQTLGRIGSPEAVASLRELLKDEDGYVRLFAAEALGIIGSPEAVASLRELLKDKDGYLRRSAARALGSIRLTSMPLTQQVTLLRQATRALAQSIGINDEDFVFVDDFIPLLTRLETLEVSQLETEIQTIQPHSGLLRGLLAGLFAIGVFLVAGLLGLLMILARIFDDLVKGQWASGLQAEFSNRPLLALALVVLLAGLTALLGWILTKLKDRL